MRIAILSDIHGNLEALVRVLEDMETQSIQQVFCLGDNVGYGPEPNEVVRLLAERRIPCVMGNHELGLVDAKRLSWFNRTARQSLHITKRMLTRETMDYVRLLPSFLVESDGLFVHGCPPDSITTYLFEVGDEEMAGLFRKFDPPCGFVGHTHELGAVAFRNGKASRFHLGPGGTEWREGYRYLINVGSVGQPRDGNNNAKYVIWDQARRRFEVRFVPYDIAKTADKIRELGLPAINASRLW